MFNWLHHHRLAKRLALGLAALVAACAVPPLPSLAPVSGLVDILPRPAERALMDGMRAYDDALYPQGESSLKRALAVGLQSPIDRAAAHKLLAFIACTSERLAECEAAFIAARAADPGFALSRSEAGHPMWGSVARRVLP